MNITINLETDPELLKEEFAKSLFEDYTDEALLKELSECCNPNCHVTSELTRRFKELKA